MATLATDLDATSTRLPALVEAGFYQLDDEIIRVLADTWAASHDQAGQLRVAA